MEGVYIVCELGYVGLMLAHVYLPLRVPGIYSLRQIERTLSCNFQANKITSLSLSTQQQTKSSLAFTFCGPILASICEAASWREAPYFPLCQLPFLSSWTSRADTPPRILNAHLALAEPDLKSSRTQEAASHGLWWLGLALRKVRAVEGLAQSSIRPGARRRRHGRQESYTAFGDSIIAHLITRYA